MRVPIIRLDTNQGIYGLGEVRDGGSRRFALFLKSRLLGENPCNVERIFKKIKQFGYHGRQGGGVSGVEMALWDLAGGLRRAGLSTPRRWFRDQIRLYCGDRVGRSRVYSKRMKERVEGLTFLKMDLGIN